MLDWFTETGFGYLLGVAVVTLIGLLFVCRGLWGDRSKGRVRCPKSWYDMRGTVPKLECPECGHDAGQERLLHNTRRRWGRTSIGVVLVLFSAYPLTIVGGWWREQTVIQKWYMPVSRYHSAMAVFYRGMRVQAGIIYEVLILLVSASAVRRPNTYWISRRPMHQ
jgi:hypothetical protein